MREAKKVEAEARKARVAAEKDAKAAAKKAASVKKKAPKSKVSAKKTKKKVAKLASPLRRRLPRRSSNARRLRRRLSRRSPNARRLLKRLSKKTVAKRKKTAKKTTKKVAKRKTFANEDHQEGRQTQDDFERRLRRRSPSAQPRVRRPRASGEYSGVGISPGGAGVQHCGGGSGAGCRHSGHRHAADQYNRSRSNRGRMSVPVSRRTCVHARRMRGATICRPCCTGALLCSLIRAMQRRGRVMARSAHAALDRAETANAAWLRRLQLVPSDLEAMGAVGEALARTADFEGALGSACSRRGRVMLTLSTVPRLGAERS